AATWLLPLPMPPSRPTTRFALLAGLMRLPSPSHQASWDRSPDQHAEALVIQASSPPASSSPRALARLVPSTPPAASRKPTHHGSATAVALGVSRVGDW